MKTFSESCQASMRPLGCIGVLGGAMWPFPFCAFGAFWPPLRARFLPSG